MNPEPSALDVFDKGYTPIPCVPGKKIPLVPWKRLQNERPPRDQIRQWFEGTRNNIAVLCGDLIVVDVDDMNEVDFVLNNCGKTVPLTRTPRGGIHLPYRARKGVQVPNHVEVKDRKIDLRALGGLVVIPNSVTENGEYRWFGQGLLPVEEYPVFKVTWARERMKKRVQSLVVDSTPDVMVRRARAWVACVEGAISGQGGHRRTFRVACKLTHPFPEGFGLSIEQAWPIIKEWNEQCEPPWSDRELTHKLEDAIKKKR